MQAKVAQVFRLFLSRYKIHPVVIVCAQRKGQGALHEKLSLRKRVLFQPEIEIRNQVKIPRREIVLHPPELEVITACLNAGLPLCSRSAMHEGCRYVNVRLDQVGFVPLFFVS